jgi:hypothetical protein
MSTPEPKEPHLLRRPVVWITLIVVVLATWIVVNRPYSRANQQLQGSPPVAATASP